MPTLTLSLNTLSAAEHQRAHRHNSAAITLVLRGDDCFSMVDGQRCDWRPWATLVTPPGARHSHHNEGTIARVPDRPGWWPALSRPHHGLFVSGIARVASSVDPEKWIPVFRKDHAPKKRTSLSLASFVNTNELAQVCGMHNEFKYPLSGKQYGARERILSHDTRISGRPLQAHSSYRDLPCVDGIRVPVGAYGC